MSQNNTTSLKVPKLRFREFWGEYREAVLTEILKIKHGFPFNSESFSRSWDYVVLTPGNFYEEWGYKNRWENQKYYLWEIPSDYILNIWDMLIAMTEQAPWLLWSPILIPETWKFLHNQRLWLVQVIDEEKFSKQFLYFFFNTKKVRDAIFSTASGTKVRHTSPDRIGKLNINLPSPREQQKIASFLSLADEKIEKLKNKKSLIEKYKKWVMQKIFSQEIRFKDENGEEYGVWEEKKLGEIFTVKAWSSKSEFISNDWQNIIVDMWAIGSQGNLIWNKKTDCSNDYLTTNDLVMAKDDIWWWNIIGKVVLIKENNKYILWDHVFKLSLLEWNIRYLYFAINSYHVNKLFRQQANGTAQIWITNPTVNNQIVLFPPLLEQQKIAAFLSEIDAKIESLSSEIERAEKWKKGLLQGMFV